MQRKIKNYRNDRTCRVSSIFFLSSVRCVPEYRVRTRTKTIDRERNESRMWSKICSFFEENDFGGTQGQARALTGKNIADGARNESWSEGYERSGQVAFLAECASVARVFSRSIVSTNGSFVQRKTFIPHLRIYSFQNPFFFGRFAYFDTPCIRVRVRISRRAVLNQNGRINKRVGSAGTKMKFLSECASEILNRKRFLRRAKDREKEKRIERLQTPNNQQPRTAVLASYLPYTMSFNVVSFT